MTLQGGPRFQPQRGGGCFIIVCYSLGLTLHQRSFFFSQTWTIKEVYNWSNAENSHSWTPMNVQHLQLMHLQHNLCIKAQEIFSKMKQEDEEDEIFSKMKKQEEPKVQVFCCEMLLSFIYDREEKIYPWNLKKYCHLYKSSTLSPWRRTLTNTYHYTKRYKESVAAERGRIGLI